MADDFVQQIARLLGQSPEDTERTLLALADSIRDEVEASGEAEIEGLGVFRREGEALAFEPAPSLARAVNHRYAGLPPIASGPKETDAPPPGETEESTDDPFAETPEPAFGLPGTPEPEPVRDLTSEPKASAPPDEPEPAEADLDAALADAYVSDSDEPAETPEAESPTFAAEREPEAEDRLEPDAAAFASDAPEDEADASEEDEDVDTMLEGVWTPATGATDAAHPLGPMPPELMEDADYAVVDEPGAEEPSEKPRADSDTAGVLNWPEDEPISSAASEPADADLPAEPPPVTPAAPASATAPTTPKPAPAFAATAASAAADTPPGKRNRPPREREDRNRRPLYLGVLAAIVFGSLLIFWFMNLNPAVPPLDEQSDPVAAGTTEASPPAVTSPGEAAFDTSAAEGVVPETVPEYEPEEPAPSDDPLRSTAGIDPAEGGFAWVVASELSRAPAERRVDEFRTQGFRAGVIAEEAGGRTRYRVALGQFATTDEANEFRANLPAGVPADTWLLRL